VRPSVRFLSQDKTSIEKKEGMMWKTWVESPAIPNKFNTPQLFQPGPPTKAVGTSRALDKHFVFWTIVGTTRKVAERSCLPSAWAPVTSHVVFMSILRRMFPHSTIFFISSARKSALTTCSRYLSPGSISLLVFMTDELPDENNPAQLRW